MVKTKINKIGRHLLPTRQEDRPNSETHSKKMTRIKLTRSIQRQRKKEITN